MEGSVPSGYEYFSVVDADAEFPSAAEQADKKCSAIVTDTFARSKPNSVKFADGESNYRALIKKKFTRSGYIIAEASFLAASPLNWIELHLWYGDTLNADNMVTRIYFRDGMLSYTSTDLMRVDAENYNVGRWNKLRLEADMINHKLYIYLNDDLVVSDAPSANAVCSGADTLFILTGKSASTEGIYVDDVKVMIP
jgi:hypothetical protein